MKLTKNLSENIQSLKSILTSDDVIFFELKLQSSNAVCIFYDHLEDKELLGKQVLTPISQMDKKNSCKEILSNITLPEGEILQTVNDCVEKITFGDTILLIDGFSEAISVACKKHATRPVAEPPTSTILKGPREGFVESIQTNLSLIRQRIKSPDLVYKKFIVGQYSSTTVGVVYINSIANHKIVDTVVEKIKKINVEGISDSSYIAKCLSNKKASLFKQVGSTEKPDILASKLLEGRIGIIVDGSPIVLTVPYLLLEDFQSSEDYYSNTYRANVSRFLRLISVIVAVLAPAFYVSAQLFHLQLIPLNFLLTIVNSIKGIPLSPSAEMFFTLLIFEILNEASIRMPRYVGIAMSVVGALVLGDTAVNAGIISTPTILIIALSGISLYTVPDLMESLSVLRIIFLIVAGTFGGYGILLLSAGLVIYLCSLESFDVPVTSPFSPLTLNDLQDGFVMSFFDDMKKRPLSLKSKNRIRRRFFNEQTKQ